ncbi:MAG: GTPase HflX, partial [Saprospiraceae bacterium]|nr:GTPase HflX [Saprospiraceae bacterium]
EVKLFATLYTTVRKVVIDRMPFLLSDTVGFIRKLPHHLVESFKSTLDETRESDLLVHVIDISHPSYEDHIATVQSTLRELGVGDIKQIMVFNKMDLYRSQAFDDLLDAKTRKELEKELKVSIRKRFDVPCFFVAAITKENIGALRSGLKEHIRSLYEVRYPYQVKTF